MSQIALGFLHDLFGLPSEIVVFCQSNVLLWSSFHALKDFHAVPWLERCVHQGHKVGK